MGKKKKRIQPHPKHNRKRTVKRKANRTDKVLLEIRQTFLERIKYIQENRSEIDARFHEKIDLAISYFQKYDKILLLGGLGLKLIVNTPNMETAFEEKLFHKHNNYDEDAEVILEYAQSFATSILDNNKNVPSQKDIDDLYNLLKELKHEYAFVELCDSNPSMENDSLVKMFDRLNFMNVRGEGYMQHVEEVYDELFTLHDDFFLQHYGCKSSFILDFLKKIDRKVFSKLGTVLGGSLAHERWCEWDKKHPDLSEVILDMKGEEQVPFIVGFLKDNPDLAGDGGDMNHITSYQVDDFESSYNIFWIVPQNKKECQLLDVLSLEFGDNAKFLAENEFKGHIANVTKVGEMPFIKYEGRYFCFSVLLAYRNLFKIVENLIKRDKKYYQTHFLGNEYEECRDNYMERKTKELLKFALREVIFYPSAKYTVVGDDGNPKDTELDVLGVGEHDVFVVEAKAHKLTDGDKRAGGKGLMDKLKDSIGYASYQSERAKQYIESSKKPIFRCNGKLVTVDKGNIKHVYKIVTTFDHFSAIICDMNNLIKEGVMQPEYKDTWLVSLFDLMVVVEYCQNSEEFKEYVKLREKVADADIYFCDELDLFAAYCNGQLESMISSKKNVIVSGLSKMFDDDYNQEALGVDVIKNDV